MFGGRAGISRMKVVREATPETKEAFTVVREVKRAILGRGAQGIERRNSVKRRNRTIDRWERKIDRETDGRFKGRGQRD